MAFMGVYVARRVFTATPVMLAASIVVFLLVDLTGDPVASLRFLDPPPDESVLHAEEARLYLDRSMPERYWLWLTGQGGRGDIGLLQGRFGPSTRGAGFDIGAEIGSRFLVTLRLTIVALTFAICFAIVAGVASARRQNSLRDHTLTIVAFLALATPTFWLGALVKEGGVWVNQQTGTHLLSTIGARSPDTRGFTPWESFTDITGHLVLPTLVLVLSGFAALMRYQRASMLEALTSDYVQLARAKGLPDRVVVRRHALRNALIPLTTVSALKVAATIDGVVVVEVIFGWDGLGQFFVESLRASDSFAIMGWLMLSGVIVIVANLGADILSGLLDPRIRHG